MEPMVRMVNIYVLPVCSTSAGAGALAAPLVATQFSQLQHWSFHYLVSLGLAISNTVILTLVFRMKTQDGKMKFAHIILYYN
jgi:hypothetical protein